MSLIDDLKERRKAANELYHEFMRNAFTWQSNADIEAQLVRDLDIAIAALTPAPAPVEINAPQVGPFTAQDFDTITIVTVPELTQDEIDGMVLEDDPDEFEDFESDDTPAEHISILTGDPAIEPEAGLHEERPALNEAMQDEREKGYAHVTNPEADALARAHDYYSPEKIAERNKFNPWGGVSNLFGKPKVDA